jgi:hypothetical protein
LIYSAYIFNLFHTHICSWPPSEDEFLENETAIPTVTKTLLERILSKREKKSAKVQRLVSSIGQDLLYHVNNGQKRTSKHATLSFSVKRKTGSKIVIQWLNKFGHGMSYDDVLVLETGLATEKSKNQDHRSFTPAVIQPSTFVTFVWDNNDINPESLRGISMHCTNGIIVQLNTGVVQNQMARVSHEEPPQFQVGTKTIEARRQKKFVPMGVELPPYIQIKRRSTEIHTQVPLNLYAEGERRSHAIDTLWVVSKLQSHKINAEQEIPNWTGFNYLLSEDQDGGGYHTIGYLPAINQSPTSHDTVLELLTQSKLKAEKIGVEEIDVVLDMAIYAKAFEILMNPRHIDLKNFIVLRLGAFHTMCIFLAVIGKRFGDAGLRDLVIESNLLGESSVEQMLRGKHYNNAMRVLKYLYDARKF